MQTKNNPNKYFIDLDVTRFFGSLFVIFEHVNTMRLTFGLKQYGHFKDLGLLAVVLFFAQSGFLITFLLLKERSKTNTINFKFYFMRRSLRIWPLYFFVMILSVFFINRIPFMQIIGSVELYENIKGYDYFVLFFLMPHFVDVFIPYFAQAWSIGIEEQFYIVQPLVVKYFAKSKWMFIGLMIMVALSSNIFQVVVFYSKIFDLENFNQATWALRIFNTLKYFGCISFGCLLAYTYLNSKRFTAFIFRKDSQFVLYFIIIALLVVAYFKPNLRPDDRVYALLFSMSMVNLAFNSDSILTFKNNFFAYLGKISFGMYLYHIIGIGIVINFMIKVLHLPLDTKFQHIILTVLSVSITYLIAHLSFKYFEKPFLGLKSKFSV